MTEHKQLLQYVSKEIFLTVSIEGPMIMKIAAVLVQV